ncbi:MAG: fluoride efflux transporter CrcB [Cyanobacteria bacterium P01_H01_bin.121]
MNWTPLVIGFGAVLGALGRYYLTLFWAEWRGVSFPYGTLFVNLTGAVLIGFLSIVLAQFAVPDILQHTLIVGFLGAYTTFSSYMLDAVKLFQAGKRYLSILFGVGSPIFGFICIEFGTWLGQYLS